MKQFRETVVHMYDERRIILPAFALVITLCFTGILLTQTASQHERDALQDEKIVAVAKVGEVNSAKIDLLSTQMADIRAAIEGLKSIGTGFGALLSGLLALDMWLRSRGKT